ncbi:DUF4376 domain-containing protein [Pseudomonas nitroreducens]|uniref:DUF4376 domain-containing protein n=1 Tax=Pseudomonas nitroreducens TaxID=46680 RepID=UPI0037FDEB75
MYYSQTTGGFYSTEIHGTNIPDDVVEITDEEHQKLLDGQSRGLLIQADESGTPELVAPPIAPVDLKAVIAARRYAAETAGIAVNGMPLDTGRDSQALVTGAALQAVIDSAYTCQWKTTEGFVDLDGPQIIAIASTMRAHVQACFDREAELLDAVAAGTYTAEQLDQGWPA